MYMWLPFDEERHEHSRVMSVRLMVQRNARRGGGKRCTKLKGISAFVKTGEATSSFIAVSSNSDAT